HTWVPEAGPGSIGSGINFRSDGTYDLTIVLQLPAPDCRHWTSTTDCDGTTHYGEGVEHDCRDQLYAVGYASGTRGWDPIAYGTPYARHLTGSAHDCYDGAVTCSTGPNISWD